MNNNQNHDQKLPYDILLEITDNPVFNTCFHEIVNTEGFLEKFNRLNFTNIKMQKASKIPFLALLDSKINPSGLIITQDEMRKLILFTYRYIYEPMKNIFNQSETA